MSLPPLRSYRTALRQLKASRRKRISPIPRVPWPLPQRYLRMLEVVGAQEISPAHRIPSGKSVRADNLLTELPKAHLGTKWMAFGSNICGDLHVFELGVRDPEVAWVNHASEGRPQRLQIGLHEWLRIAYLAKQLERYDEVHHQQTETTWEKQAAEHKRQWRPLIAHFRHQLEVFGPRIPWRHHL